MPTLATLMLLAAAEPAPAELTRPRLQVVVDVEPDVELRTDDVREIAAGVRRMWRGHADLLVVVRGEPARGVAEDELRVVITNRLLRDGDSSGLGWIEFVNGEPQPAATISMTAVRGLMRYATWRGASFDQLPPITGRYFVRRATARAVAHEVGHYLLRSRAHARTGLMRATFTIDDIMDGRPQVEWLEPAHAARLRQTARDLPVLTREGA